MDKTKALQNLLKGKATKKEIELLQQALASGDLVRRGDFHVFEFGWIERGVVEH